MPNRPNWTNPYTGEVLANAIEVCCACKRNFASTKAGDQHRKTVEGVRVCVEPTEAGLELIVNSFGALIYRRPVKGVGAGIREPIRKSAKELVKTV
jgi:hypothetical protein